MLRCFALAAVLVSCSAACGGDDGSLLLVDAQTDLAPGREFDLVRVTLLDGDRTLRTTEAPASERDDFAEGHRVAELGGLANGTYRVRVEALRASAQVVARTVEITLSGDAGIVVLLTRSCVGVRCPGTGDEAGATECVGGVCERPSCISGTESSCGAAECRHGADCAAGNACVEARCIGQWCAQVPRDERCIGGTCDAERGCVADGVPDGGVDGGVVTCADGTADCNGDATDGCEASLSSPASCGTCDNACGSGTPLCAGGSCAALCMDGTTLCAGSCVDTRFDPTHCGSCDTPCATPSHASAMCTNGGCGFTCVVPFEDCNRIASDGCEVDTFSRTNCGSCGHSCTAAHASSRCDFGRCTLGMCDAGWADCNGSPDDGCEASLDTVSDCGGCGSTCSRAHATPTCGGGVCRIATCNSGFGNCNGVDADGCEASLTTDANCGACGMSCGTGTGCVGSMCVPL